MKALLAALAAISILAACSSSPAEDAANLADGKYLTDLDARNVPTGVTNGAPPELGHAICTDLASGSADAKVMQVANLQLGNVDQFTTSQAEEIVYWAVTELCPQYTSQLQDHWRDGN